MRRKNRFRTSRLRWPDAFQVIEMEGSVYYAMIGQEPDGRPHYMCLTRRSQAAALAATLVDCVLHEDQSIWDLEPEHERRMFKSNETINQRMTQIQNRLNASRGVDSGEG